MCVSKTLVWLLLLFHLYGTTVFWILSNVQARLGKTFVVLSGKAAIII